jgi:hypothetical protein
MVFLIPSLTAATLACVGAAPGPAPDGEWTLEEALKCWDPMTKPVQHVGVPGCENQVGVYADGSLLFGDLLHCGKPFMGTPFPHPEVAAEQARLGRYELHLSIAHGETMRFADRGGTNAPVVRRWLESGRLPIPHIETRDGDLVWEQTVFAHLLGRAPAEGMDPRLDDVLVAHVLVSVRNTGTEPRQAGLWLHFGDLTAAAIQAQGPTLGGAIDHRFAAPFGFLAQASPMFDETVRYVIPAPERGELIWHDRVDAVEGARGPAERVIEWRVTVRPGEDAALRLLLPCAEVDKRTARRIAALDSDRLLAETRGFWSRLVAGPGRISTPDRFVNDCLGAVVGQMAQQVGYRHVHGLWMYKTSPNWYEDYYPSCAARGLPVFDLRGLTGLSAPVLRSFVDTQTDDVGLLDRERAHTGYMSHLSGEGFEPHPGFLSNFGRWTANSSLSCHGLELWALASHYRVTRDDAWLRGGGRSPLDAIVAACEWIGVQRSRTMRTEDGTRVPHWGLLPAASAHDWLSGNAICNDAWCIYGMAEAVRLLREVEHPRTEEFARDLVGYRSCLRAAYERARDGARPLPLADGTEIPFVPRMVTELDWARVDWTYLSYGPARAGGCGALDPQGELVDQTFRLVDAGFPREGNATERVHYWPHLIEPETHWPMYDLLLERDDVGMFVELLFNNLAAAVHRDWRVGCEGRDGVPSCAPADAERWRMVRCAFVREREGYDGSQQSLWLLQGVPRSWLRPGDVVSVEDMGTHFGGKVTLHARTADDGASLRVDASLALSVAPREIRMRLRSGDGRPLRSATVDGRQVRVLAGDTIALPRGTSRRYRIEGRF